ncbi:MAG: hypothetical protein OET79_08865 [Nitrospirota bacterium]|nr:hypothetical protein [Nitrospirota bacterium]
MSRPRADGFGPARWRFRSSLSGALRGLRSTGWCQIPHPLIIKPRIP